MNPSEVRPYLDSFINYEHRLQDVNPSVFKLDRMRRLLDRLGNPQRDLKCLHVAGTKGKGSSCAFTAQILRSAGFSVGLYTSPHLCDFNERIRILSLSDEENPRGFVVDGCLSNEDAGLVLEEMRPVIDEMRASSQHGKLTYYEILTALAFYYFRRRQVDFAVLETGLGGRLDATNTADAMICGISPISLEHQAQLGATLEHIAAEKAAIIKYDRQVVVTAQQPFSVMEVIRQRCAQTGSRFYEVGKNIHYEIFEQTARVTKFEVKGIHGIYPLETVLLGRHQAGNASLAVAMVESLQEFGVVIDADSIIRGVRETVWPGRMEILRDDPCILLDGAHNPSSAGVLAASVREIFPGRRVILVCAFSDDKDISGICRELREISNDVILTRTGHPRSFQTSEERLKELFPGRAGICCADPAEAVSLALKKAQENDIILITGSIYLVGEMKRKQLA